MKKILAILLALAMLCAFVACGKTNDDTETTIDEDIAESIEEASEEAEEASEEASEEAEEASEEASEEAEEASEEAEEEAEETTKEEKGLNSTKAEEVVAYYDAAVLKTKESKKEFNGTNAMKLDGDITADGGLGAVLKIAMPIITKTLEKNSGTQSEIPGEGKLLATDVKSASATSKNGVTTIKIVLKDQTDGPSADANTAGPVARGIGTLGNVEIAIEELGAELYSGKENIKLTYNDSYITATIDEDTGMITGGTWHYKVNINISAIEVKLGVKISAKNLKGIIDWTITI